MRQVPAVLAAVSLSLAVPAAGQPPGSARLRVQVSYPAALGAGPFDGRLLLLLSTDASQEPRFQVSDTALDSQQVFGIDVRGWRPGEAATFDAHVLGYPLESLAQVPAGDYQVQALLHKYETFRRADGHVVQLPMDRGEGQQWNRAPGNLFSTPRRLRVDPGQSQPLVLQLHQVMPPIPDPPESRYVRHERIRSERLSKFWGRDMYLGAHVLLPWGWDEHPDARYPLVIDHGHFSAQLEGFREQPPDPGLKPEYSERFHLEGYNRIMQEAAHQLYRDWTSPGFPRAIVVQIQHANPYYDDSYAVNSQNLGPYGDAINYELVP